MSVVVLEGINGVGKSAYAKMMSERTGLPIIRPFRHARTDLHWEPGQELFDKLRGWGVPVNSHVDDLYVADLLAATGGSGILDRAMPSAVAYAHLRGEAVAYEGKKLMAFWQQLLIPSGLVVYAWLRAPHEVAKERAAGRWCPNKRDYDKLDKAFEKCFNAIDRMHKVQINTSEIEVEDGVERLCRLLKTSDAG